VSATILVVDDNGAVRELLAELLRVQGFEVVTASDGEAALAEFSRQQPALVLLDVVMPGLDGFDVCRRLKQDPEHRLTPVVLVTGLSATEDRVRGIEAGADDFLSKPVDRTELFARVRSLLSLKAHTDELERAEAVLFALARSIEGKDPYTEGHCERVSDFAIGLAKEIGLSEPEQKALKNGGILHDIGKIAIDEAILNKPGKLTPEEFEKMKSHPAKGAEICSNLKTLTDAIPIIRSHHEKCDGSGYPDGLKKDEIPVIARIMAIVDVYDAIITDRPYRKGLPLDTAENILRTESQKGWWDPELVDVFFKMLKK